MCTEENEEINCRRCSGVKDWKLSAPNTYYGVCLVRRMIIFQKLTGFYYHTYDRRTNARKEHKIKVCQHKPQE